MAEAKKGGNLLQFVLVFIAIYLGMQLVLGIFFPPGAPQQPLPGPVLTSSVSFTIGNHPVLRLENRPSSTQSFGVTGWIQSKWCALKRLFTGTPTTSQCAAQAVQYGGKPYTLQSRCPQPPVDIYDVQHPGEAGESLTPVTSSDTTIPCEPALTLAPGDSAMLSLGPWKYSLFEKVGTYEVRLPGTVMPPKSASGSVAPVATVVRFTITEPGVFTKLFRTFISAPFLNFLIFIASVSPYHSLGIAIILLTLVVKLLLFFPTQHAMEGQKKMQLLQPKLEAIKAKYKDDPKKVQEETMKLWKEHKINPFQSCLPLLIQFPVLIGLVYVIRDESNLALSRHLIYPIYQNLSWHFGTAFLGWDLLKPDYYVLPILLVVLQFIQMKLSFSIQKRKKNKDAAETQKPQATEAASPQAMQQNMMLYLLPLMIGFFALQFPSAVALYWGISTLFGIGQQMIVNREHLRV